MHRKWKRKLVQKVISPDLNFALDICCGTGDLTKILENHASNHCKVIGLDFSSEMLAIAKKKNSQKRKFILGDALHLPFKDEEIDAVTIGFGLRNLENLKMGLTEIHRVLKKGGKFACLDMGKIQIPILKQLFHSYFFFIVPIIGKLLMHRTQMFTYFPNSTKTYPSPAELKLILKNIGFQNVHYESFHFGAVGIHYGEKNN